MTRTRHLPLRSRYQVQRWEPGREVRLFRPAAGLGKLARVLAGVALAILLLVWTALGMLAGDMTAWARFQQAAGAALGFGCLALTGLGVVWLVVRASSPRTVVFDWSSGRLGVGVRGRRTDHPFASLRGLELRRVEVTGEVSDPSHWCGIYARVAADDGAARPVEILKTDLLDDRNQAYGMTATLAAELAEALGLQLAETEQRF